MILIDSARLGPLMEHKVRLHFDERLMEGLLFLLKFRAGAQAN